MEFLCNLIGFCPRQRRVRDNNVCLCEREGGGRGYWGWGGVSGGDVGLVCGGGAVVGLACLNRE